MKLNIGKLGEDAAEKYLKRRGWRILARNYRVRGGEIDIVAFRFGVLMYAEVKTRSSELYGSPADAVDDEKIWHIYKAKKDLTDHYLREGRIPVGYGFFSLRRKVHTQRNDIIEVYTHRSGEIKRINQIKDAFE